MLQTNEVRQLPVRADAEVLNIEDDRQIASICVVHDCMPTDVYVAIAMVGDKIRNVHNYLVRTAKRRENVGSLSTISASFPPVYQGR